MIMSEQAVNFEQTEGSPINGRNLGIGVAVLAVVGMVGYALDGEARSVVLASLNALPFAILALLAYLGTRFGAAAVGSILWALLLVGGVALGSFGYTFSALAGPIDPETPTLPNFNSTQLFQLGLVFGGSAFACIVGAICCLPVVRRALSRIIPINPDSFVHVVALASVLSISLIALTPLLVLGAPPLLTIVSQNEDLDLTGGRDAAGQLRDLVYGLVWTIPCAIVAVGYGVRRNLADALERLGLVRPSLRQVGIGIVAAIVLVIVVQLLSQGMSWLWGLVGWPQTDDAAFGELLSFAINPIGAVVIGVTAGLGEELAVRGVLQPRLGIFLSNIFFTSLHAFQYNWDALIIVFLVGTVCGLVRNRTNTTTAAIVHGVYNFLLVMLAVATAGMEG
jgi:uncharacterized protein